MSILKSIFKSRDKPTNFLNQSCSFLFGSTTSGKTVNERTAMQTTVVYACVRILTIASLPLHTYRYTDKDKEKAFDYPLYYLLHNEPNPEKTKEPL
jgi:phage portal protein BeeE